MKTIEIKPIDGRKSFYGKARVYETPDGIFLLSYDTVVCSYNSASGMFWRMWDGYSQTTMRHVNAFLAYLGLPYGGKSFWTGLPLWEPVKLG